MLSSQAMIPSSRKTTETIVSIEGIILCVSLHKLWRVLKIRLEPLKGLRDVKVLGFLGRSIFGAMKNIFQVEVKLKTGSCSSSANSLDLLFSLFIPSTSTDGVAHNNSSPNPVELYQ